MHTRKYGIALYGGNYYLYEPETSPEDLNTERDNGEFYIINNLGSDSEYEEYRNSIKQNANGEYTKISNNERRNALDGYNERAESGRKFYDNNDVHIEEGKENERVSRLDSKLHTNSQQNISSSRDDIRRVQEDLQPSSSDGGGVGSVDSEPIHFSVSSNKKN